MICNLCRQDSKVVLAGLCCLCTTRMPELGRVTVGQCELYLARWAAAQKWCAEHGRSVV